MSLIAYNMTTAAVVLDFTDGPTLPASSVAGQRGAGVNVTSEVRDLVGADFEALQVQVTAGDIQLEWTGGREFQTPGLILGPVGAKLFSFTPDAPDDNVIHAGVNADDDSEATAELDLGTLADGDLDTVLEAAAAGYAGNSITVAAVGDSPTGGGVTLTEDADAKTLVIHYESGVSTVDDVETALDDSTLVAVKTGGTGATVLTATADDFAATALAGGLDDVDFPPPFVAPDVPRTLNVKFGTDWDGGDVIVTGLDQFGNEVSETFETMSNDTRVGAKVFASVTRVVKSEVGEETIGASLGTGELIGVPQRVADAVAQLTADGTGEAVTVSTANSTFAPDTAPDGAVVFLLLANVELG